MDGTVEIRRAASASRLRELFRDLCPFQDDLSLRPEEERRTVLAANANFPVEVQLAAFIMAAAADGGSPLIVQFSSQALETLGRALCQDHCDRTRSILAGARIAAHNVEAYLDIYSPPFVAVGLDHFGLPNLSQNLVPAGCRDGSHPADDVYSSGPTPPESMALLEEAVEASRAVGFGPPSQEEMASWEAYLNSQEFRSAVNRFIVALKELKPAWAMIDTEDLPPILNFAVTKYLRVIAREVGSDAIIEAEFGATGQAGRAGEYRQLSGDELQAFAAKVAGFVAYTGAEGISYPIGMEHGAPEGEKHEPDVVRLEVVQREIMKTIGRYVPFAQHGGTGARTLARGLVGKDNVNTLFLVAGARALRDYALARSLEITRGIKSACGPTMYLVASQAIYEACTAKLKECGTYGFLRLYTGPAPDTAPGATCPA